MQLENSRSIKWYFSHRLVIFEFMCALQLSSIPFQHDGTILSLMSAMNVANDLFIPYAAAVIMEIYKDNEEYFVEVGAKQFRGFPLKYSWA